MLVTALLIPPATWAQKKAEPVKAPQKAVTRTKVPDNKRPEGKWPNEVFFCQTASPECRGLGTSFDITKLRDLYVFATWPDLSGNFTQTVEFYLPDGSLYLKKSTPFMVRNGQPLARRQASSTLPEWMFTKSRGVPAVVTPLPVAGTFITQRNLTGTWTVRVLLDGALVMTAQFQFFVPAP
ncbi:MAG TPA: hypothetical protein VNL38_00660 [Candidatus Nitrosotenuis sp.]|nr:hypothetical protein [Candidatus Nitrosotenuis sp.]